MTEHPPSVKKGVPDLYDLVQNELRGFQTLAIFEVTVAHLNLLCQLAVSAWECLQVAHCLVGLVKANLFTTLMQVYSRLFILWGVIEAVPQVGIYLSGLSEELVTNM